MALITLTSDFGLQDYIAGAVKGQLLQIDPEFRIHDVSHQIAPFNYPQAAYICRNALWQFPRIPIILSWLTSLNRNPNISCSRALNGQYIFCADNGLLQMILPAKPDLVVGLPLDQNEIKNTLYCTRRIGLAIRALESGPIP